MQKDQNSTSMAIKWFFAAVCLFFFVLSLAMPDRGRLWTGWLRILSQPSKLSTNYFALGGYSAAFFNAAMVGLICLLVYQVSGFVLNGTAVLAFLLTTGFALWGVHPMNIWPGMLGVALYSLLTPARLRNEANTMLFSTALAPLYSDLMLRYPGTQVLEYHWQGILLAAVVGIFAGFFLPSGMLRSADTHKWFTFFSAALPIGVMALLLRGLLYQVLGGVIPEGPGAAQLEEGSRLLGNLVCGIFFLACIITGVFLGAKPREYRRILEDSGYRADFPGKYGFDLFLFHLGVYGLFLLWYFNLIGANFNAVTMGCIFCTVSCAGVGATPKNVWPILAGYAGSSFLFGLLHLGEGAFSQVIRSQSMVVGACFATGLAPISGEYGWPFGIVAGVLHFLMVTSVPLTHGGFNLYNGGLTAAFVCMLYVPVLQRFFKRKGETDAV